MKIALVHDWLTGFRGGERVLDHLAKRFPEADLYTLVHVPGQTSAAIDAMTIRTSPLDRLPGIRRHYRKFLPLFPWAIRRFDFTGYDLVISTSHAVAGSVRVPPGVAHLCYCFTPMRYIWDQVDAYLGRSLKRVLARPLIAALRRFDVATSDRAHVTRYVALSREVADRIRVHYGREADVVAPPVDISWLESATESNSKRLSGLPRDYYLLVGGFVPYKRDALAIEAFRGLERPLVVVGDGPGRAALEASASANIHFTGHVDDASLGLLYRDARALIYPQLEDFGLVAVEAQAAGRPVIAFGAGGVLDTVRPLPVSAGDGRLRLREAPTGVFFDRVTVESLAEAIERFEKSEMFFEADRIKEWAERFSPQRFDEAFDLQVSLCLKDQGHDQTSQEPTK